MAKMACVILGLAFLLQGILGITGVVLMFRTDPISVNIGQIVLGVLGVVIGTYARQNMVSYKQRKEASKQRKEIDQQRKEIDQQRKEIDQQKKPVL